jgi:hypothetical protein
MRKSETSLVLYFSIEFKKILFKYFDAASSCEAVDPHLVNTDRFNCSPGVISNTSLRLNSCISFH